MTWFKPVLAALLTGGTMMVTQAGPARLPGAPLLGHWGGEQVQLTADTKGVTLQTDCASGAISGPLTPGADGRFVASGSFEPHTGGPRHGDAVVQANARYSGEISDGVMKLTVLPAGASTPLQFTLREGVRTKLLRCM